MEACLISLSILRIRCSSRFCIVSEASRSLPIASFVEFPPPLFPEGVGAAAFGFERPKRFIATRPASNTNNAASLRCVPLDISAVHGHFRPVAPRAPPSPRLVSTSKPNILETSHTTVSAERLLPNPELKIVRRSTPLLRYAPNVSGTPTQEPPQSPLARTPRRWCTSQFPSQY